MIRLFVALRPPAPVRDLLLDLETDVDDARWQNEDQLHLTLRFIGEVERAVAEDLADLLGRLHAPAPIVRLAGVGAFGGRGRSGSLWAGVEPREPLAALHRKVDQLCVRAGLAPEHRAFRPHVTVARLSRRVPLGGPEVTRWLQRHAALTSDAFTLERAILYASRLGRDGATYEPLLAIPLCAGDRSD
ncbi:MAG TPA: RNA 2',3'-cyclic phosphodiesterase [Sphingomonas sp.]|jgi:2'-5' RNA ligase|uniref:RNA 2',3'-cyclic phosphodiesterase n=1 Tax=Sphingomonas sp. TaxID=28214 RepID=UPI002EDB8A0B